MAKKNSKIDQAKRLFQDRLNGPKAAAAQEFVDQARKGIKPLLQAVREAEQITADDRRVYINARSDS